MNRHIIMFESFGEESLKNADPNKPIFRDDLEGSPYNEDKNVPNLNVMHAIEFIPSGTFSAITNARKYLEDLGYSMGSMEGGYPIGFADSDEYDYISKWNKMSREEHKLLDGVIIPTDGGFREGGNIVLWFKETKY